MEITFTKKLKLYPIGNVVTQIRHKEFENILEHHKEMYGADFEEYFDKVII